MDREQNTIEDAASRARLKRKSVLRDRGTNFSRSRVHQSIRMQNQQLHVQPTSRNITPLSDITSNILNQRNQDNSHLKANFSSNSSGRMTPFSNITSSVLNQRNGISTQLNANFSSNSFMYTQPSRGQNPCQAKKKAISIDALGVNLMSRFDEMNQNSFSENQNRDFHGKASSSSMHNNTCDSLDGEENPSNVQIPSVEETLTSDSNSSSEEDEIYDNAVFAEPANEFQGYSDIGDPLIKCEHCGACMWYSERSRKHRQTHSPKYELCCSHGRVQIPLLIEPPPLLQHLLFDNDSADSKNFQQHIRLYNMMFSFTSPGAKLDRSINDGRGPPTIRIQGQPCHRIGSMIAMPGQTPKFAQLYIYDTENEIQNRIQGFRSRNNIDPQIVSKLSAMLYESNEHAKSFRLARERLQNGDVVDLRLKLISSRSTDGRINNLPSCSEVAALIVGDVDSAEKRDIIMETQSGELQRIDELHASYLAYNIL